MFDISTSLKVVSNAAFSCACFNLLAIVFEGSLQYLVKSWSTIVELISVWKRLREFEINLEKNILMEIVK